AARVGAGPVAAAGGLSFTAGPLWWLAALGPEPAYATGMLPGQLLTGLGVGLILPSLSSVVGSALPAPRWGAGSSLVNTARQIGAVLGTALSVTVVGATTTGRGELALLRHGWIMLVVCGAAAAATGAVLAVVEAVERRAVATGGAP
ncbi:MAG: MFS transporter, partial [Actinomycetota bacterium]|nr:MFS transporter [Actinomycetota bacterium]